MNACERDTVVRTWIGGRFKIVADNMNRLCHSASFAAPAAALPPGNPLPAGVLPGNPPPVGGIPAGAAGNPNPVVNHNGLSPLVTLSNSPASIHDLWAEYTVGIAGRKPAKDFTARERGRGKYLYSRRNQVWMIIKDLVNAGFDHDVACDKIYQAYGHNMSVSKIIKAIYKDKPDRHPNLRI